MYPYPIFSWYRAASCTSHEPLYSRRCPACIWADTEIVRRSLWIYRCVSHNPDRPRRRIRDSGPLRNSSGWHAENQYLLLWPHAQQPEGGIENVHTMLRMILPKGTVFESLTQWDIRKAVNHINSAPRENLGGETPYKLAQWKGVVGITDIIKLSELQQNSPLHRKKV